VGGRPRYTTRGPPADPLLGGEDLHRRRLAASHETRGAEEDGFVAERLPGLGVDEREAGPVDLPQAVLRFAKTGDVRTRARADVVAAFLRRDDLGRAVETAALDHQRLGQERLDHLQRDRPGALPA